MHTPDLLSGISNMGIMAATLALWFAGLQVFLGKMRFRAQAKHASTRPLAASLITEDPPVRQ